MRNGDLQGETSFVHGDSNRLFLNTSLGCNSQCSYCYLPDLGFSVGTNALLTTSPETVIEYVKASAIFREGRDGTLISIGCYSECWDAANKSSTVRLIEKFLSFGNPLQFATKRFVDPKELSYLADKQLWSGQLGIYISNATISQWKKYERGTTSPEKRFQSFRCSQELGVPAFLYIKPVIEAVTIDDLAQYSKIVAEWGVDAIVGDVFEANDSSGANTNAPIAGAALFVRQSQECQLIADELSKFCSVFRNSTEAVDFLRRGV